MAVFNVVKDTVYKVNQVAGSYSGKYNTGVTIGAQEYISSMTAGPGKIYVTTSATASKTIHMKFYAGNGTTYTLIADAIFCTQKSGTTTKALNELTWTTSNLNAASTAGKTIYIEWEGPGTITWSQIKGSTAGVGMTMTTTAITYALTVSKGTGIASVSGGGSFAYNAKAGISATASTGYSFKNWSTSNGGSFGSSVTATTTYTMPANASTVTANGQINTYTLATTVSPASSGSVTAGASMTYNTTKSLTATASTGYTFSSWGKTSGTLSSTTANPTSFTIGASNATVTANFTLNSYTLTTAVSPASTGSVTAGGTMGYNTKKQLTATASTGYKFSSWSKTAGTLSSTTANPTTFTMGAGAATVTANFTLNSFALTTAVSPSGSGSVTGGATMGYNTKKQLTATASTGYTFSSWSKTSGTLSSTTANPVTFTMGNAAATVTANFTLNSFALTTAVSPSGGGSVTAGATMGYNTKRQLTATASTGYTFSSWSKTSGTLSSTSTNPTTFTMGNAAATVTANFTLNSYTLTTAVSPSGGGTVTAGGSMGYNTKKQLTATASTGYTFSSWSKTAGTLSSTSTNPTTFTISTSNATVTANFTLNSYTLTTAVSPSGGGTVTAGGTMGYNTKKQLTATASTGYTFSSWSKTAGTLSSTSTNPTTFTISTGNATVTANFTLNSYTLTTQVSPSGGGTVTAGATMGYNTTKQLTATASTGYTFSGWATTSGTLSSASASPTTFTISNADAIVTASFTHNTYTLTVNASPAGGGSVTGGATYYYADNCAITATPSTGYSFVNWTTSSGGSFGDSTSTVTTYTMPNNDATVTANFALTDYTVTTSANPLGAGTVSASPSTANMGDTVTLTQIPATGYIFDSWSSSPTLTITNNTFTMPASNVSIIANYQIGTSTGSLDKSAYVAGESAQLTITSASNTYTHKYKLHFSNDIDTGYVDVAAGITSVSIYLPIAWSMKLNGSTSITGGTLTLETYSGTTLLGTDTITGLSYSALDSTIPSLSVWRTDANGNAKIDGTYARYSFVKPSSISTWSLTCGANTSNNPSATGDILPTNRLTIPLENEAAVHFILTTVYETVDICEYLPLVKIIGRNIAITHT